jgi:peptide/nickel transport system substrate-binding protein/oligopeptide transport system substrate-binding protein
MKLSEKKSRYFASAVFLFFFFLPVFLDSCKAFPASYETMEDEQSAISILPPQEDEPDYVETRPRITVRDELTVVFSRQEMEMDFRKSFIASEAQVFTAIYEGLFSYNPITMSPVLAAASRWETSEDKKTWTFTIRESARFQNGDPLRAEDFRASWLSLLNPRADAPYSSLFDIIEKARDYRQGKCSASEVGISVSGEKTLIVRLNSPAAFFPSMLCHHSFSPIHPSMLNVSNWSAGKPVSNGPFFIEQMDDEKMVLRKNLNYWDARRVSLNKLTIKFTDDGNESSAMWNSGEARWIHGDVNIEALRDRSGIEVNAMFATHYYYIRSARRPWNDFRLRRALSLVLPWDKIREGHSLPAKTLIFPISDYPKIDGLETANLEEAERLMAEAGYAKGVNLPELIIRIPTSMEAERIAQLMAGAWYEKLGVPVKIDVVPFRQYFQSLKRNDYDVGSTTWIGDFADPYTFLQMWCRDSNLNDARHNDSDYEALIEKSMTEEGAKRWETLAEAEKLLLARGSVLPISYSPAVNIVDLGEIEGWYANVLDIHPFKYLAIRVRRPLPGVVSIPDDQYFLAAHR